MGEPARKFDLFDSDPVEADAFVSPPPPRRARPTRRRAEPTRDQPARREPFRAVPAPAPPRRVDRADGADRVDRDAPAAPRARAERPDDVLDAPPAPVAAPRAPFVMLVLVLVAAGIVGLLVLNTKINENSYQLQQLRDHQAELDTKEQNLRSQLAARQSPGNLAAAARRLGLVRATSPALLRLPDGQVISVPGAGGDGTNRR